MFIASMQGTCARSVSYTIVEGCVSRVRFAGGCDGNLKGLARLLEGLPVQDAVERLSGITCGSKTTSCPDQLAQALRKELDKTAC